MTAPVRGAAGAVPGAPDTSPAFAAAPAVPPPQEQSGFSWTDIGHTALDVAGLVPVVGEVAVVVPLRTVLRPDLASTLDQHLQVTEDDGNLTPATSPTGAVTRFEHTHFDLVAARIEPDGSRFEQAWDSEMRLVGVRSLNGLRWTYEYDPAGRLIVETDFDGRRRTYDLDAAG